MRCSEKRATTRSQRKRCCLNRGERQVSPTLEGIRRDHLARYEWAAKTLRKESRVIDAACGIGYGSFILAKAGHRVFAFDISAEAIDYAKEHYSHPNITYRVADVTQLTDLQPCDAAVSFETIEHLANPALLLQKLAANAPLLLASVPNETYFPWRGYAFHHRHYTADEFLTLLESVGYRVNDWLGQVGDLSEVEPEAQGRTVIVTASRRSGESKSPPAIDESKARSPKHVAILGMGPSLERFVDLTKRMGGASAFCDEVWGINALGDIIKCDRIFHMDDVRVQEIRAAARPQSNIAMMLNWMRKHPGPIYTSQVPEDCKYPGLVEYPLQDVLNSCGIGYFNSTAAYAVAFAIHIGVEEISLYGCDFTYPNSHQAEMGRACVEFWLGMAYAKGIKLGFSDNSSIMDSIYPEEQKFYGFDAVHIDIETVDGMAKVGFRPRELPTADEIEARYDHSKPSVHPKLLT